MGERGLGIRSGVNKQGWEDSEFPILCDKCLGDNPFVRMSKQEFARACKICERPFTVFRWRPGQDAHYKKTEICQICAKLKNACQTCVMDIEYKIPLELRDKLIKHSAQTQMPKLAENRTFWAAQINNNIDKLALPFDDPETKERLEIVAKAYHEQNKPKLAPPCSFFVKSTC